MWASKAVALLELRKHDLESHLCKRLFDHTQANK